MSDEAPRSRSSRQRTAEAEAQTERTLLGTVAIVGEPNAGKSPLVNRLTEKMVFEGAEQKRNRHRLLVLIDEFPSLNRMEIFADALLNPEGTEGVEPKTWAAAAEIVEKWIQQRAALVDSDIKMPSSVA